MDVLYFLIERTGFIRSFYERASAPFHETIRKMEAEEEPFVPEFGEYGGDSEPPFLAEWLDADTSLELLGRSCLSMLSASLQLYFKQWEVELRLSCGVSHAVSFKQRGMLHGYRTCFTEVLGINWNGCPADLTVLEQVTLARNLDQHPETISTFGLMHSKKDFRKFPHPFFSDDFPPGSYEDPDTMGSWWWGPRLRVPREKLLQAIDQVDLLARWFAEQVFAVRR